MHQGCTEYRYIVEMEVVDTASPSKMIKTCRTSFDPGTSSAMMHRAGVVPPNPY